MFLHAQTTEGLERIFVPNMWRKGRSRFIAPPPMPTLADVSRHTMTCRVAPPQPTRGLHQPSAPVVHSV